MKRSMGQVPRKQKEILDLNPSFAQPHSEERGLDLASFFNQPATEEKRLINQIIGACKGEREGEREGECCSSHTDYKRTNDV